MNGKDPSVDTPSTVGRLERLKTDPHRWVLPLACGLTVLVIQGTYEFSPFDDAYITYRYARNLSQGLGFVYNTGERVLATTTPLFTLVLSLAATIFGPAAVPAASAVISLVADAVSSWLVFRLAGWVFDRWELATLTALAFALQPFRIDVARGGMEASFFLLLLLLTYERVLVARRYRAGAAIAALALLTRVEAVLALAPLLAWLAISRREALSTAAIVGIVSAPWVIWATAYFGSPIPQSIVAKSVAYRNPLGFGLFFILTFLGTGTVGPYTNFVPVLSLALFALVLIVVGTVALARHRPASLSLVLFPILYLAIMSVVNAPMYFPWYFVPLIPGLLISQVAGVWYLPLPQEKVKLVAAALLAATVTALPALLMWRAPTWSVSRDREAVYRELCEPLREEIPDDGTLLTPDIGVLGWCLPEVRILDPIGLVSPISLAYISQQPGRALISPDLVLAEQPEYVVGLEQYVEPSLTSSAAFTRSYQELWRQSVRIAGDEQGLYVYRRR